MNKFEALQILGLSGQVDNDDIKSAYRRKANQFHPDRNPAGMEIMKMINVAYDLVKDQTSINVFEDKVMNDYPEEVLTALSAVSGLGMDIEICGLWVWVSGDTKPHKEVLKSSGYYWSPKKQMWYYRPANAKSRKYLSRDKSEWSMDRIRTTYGVKQPVRKKFYSLEDK